MGEVWAPEQQKELARAIRPPEKFDSSAGWEKFESFKGRLVELRAIVSSQPKLAKIGKKEPDILELKIDGGSIQDRVDFGRKVLGREVRISEVFKGSRNSNTSRGKPFEEWALSVLGTRIS